MQFNIKQTLKTVKSVVHKLQLWTTHWEQRNAFMRGNDVGLFNFVRNLSVRFSVREFFERETEKYSWQYFHLYQ